MANDVLHGLGTLGRGAGRTRQRFAVELLLGERERWLLWAPVALALGVAGYFSLAVEPPIWVGPAWAGLSFGLALLCRRRTWLALPLLGLALVGCGLAAGQIRTMNVAAPVLTEKIGPVEVRGRLVESEVIAENVRTITFEQACEQYIAAHEASWRNVKHRKQWRSSFATYAWPTIGKLAVADIDTAAVTSVLEAIWRSKTEIASRLRGRIENVLDWATVRGHREGENPARWRGHLEALLPARSNIQRVQHHSALPYADIGSFMAEFRERAGFAAIALEFAILTAARSGEVLGATWDEIDLKRRVWTVPAKRMKAELAGTTLPFATRDIIYGAVVLGAILVVRERST